MEKTPTKAINYLSTGWLGDTHNLNEDEEELKTPSRTNIHEKTPQKFVGISTVRIIFHRLSNN
jgi:hypothetical protein